MNLDYLTSVSVGLFIGSLILFIGRLFNFPITGVILAIIFSALITSFLYNPSSKKEPKHRSLRGSMASFLLCLIFSIILTIYYIPHFSNVLSTADLSISVSIMIILFITVIGGFVIGTLGGSIGSTFRDLVTVVTSEKNKRKHNN